MGQLPGPPPDVPGFMGNCDQLPQRKTLCLCSLCPSARASDLALACWSGSLVWLVVVVAKVLTVDWLVNSGVAPLREHPVRLCPLTTTLGSGLFVGLLLDAC